MKYTIEVTQEDIDRGTRRNCKLCPVALAIKRVFNLDCGVGTCSCRIGNDVRYLPDRATAFIIGFDDGDKVSPFTFTIEL